MIAWRAVRGPVDVVITDRWGGVSAAPYAEFNLGDHVGAALALAGAVWLLMLALPSGDPWKVFSVAVYGVTLVILYSASTLYHSVRGRAKRILQKLDHQNGA